MVLMVYHLQGTSLGLECLGPANIGPVASHHAAYGFYRDAVGYWRFLPIRCASTLLAWLETTLARGTHWVTDWLLES
jgi:hypothetical protein